MIDRARNQEEAALVEGVHEQKHDRGLDAGAVAEAEQHHERAERGDGRVGEDLLEVGVPQCPHRPHDHRRTPHRGERPDPRARAAEDRVHPRQEVHARLHHRRRVQVGAHRRRGGHRVGQPEVEGHLGGLREGPDCDENEGGEVERVRLNLAGPVHEHRDLVRPTRHAEQQDADQQGEAAGAGHQQRLQGRGARVLLLVLEAHQQVGAEARGLPEDEQEQEVVGQHHAEHRAHEREEREEEAPEIAVPLQVAPGVDRDDGAEARDEDHEQQAQPVEDERRPHVERRDPGGRLPNDCTIPDRGSVRRKPPEQGHRPEGEHPPGGPPGPSHEKRRHQGPDDGEQKSGEHGGMKFMSRWPHLYQPSNTIERWRQITNVGPTGAK